MNSISLIDFQFGKDSDLYRRCKEDIEYLRTRSRHTKELEKELINLHIAGTPPNMSEFGVTKETQNNLLDRAMVIVNSKLQQ